jgi:hypothetical protein
MLRRETGMRLAGKRRESIGPALASRILSLRERTSYSSVSQRCSQIGMAKVGRQSKPPDLVATVHATR